MPVAFRPLRGALAALALAGCADLIGFPDYHAASGTGATGGSGGTGATGGSGGTGATGGSGGATVCIPKAKLPCYDGPPETEGIGLCKGGTKVCADDGSGYGPCSSQVTPQLEHCATTGVDEDCDGRATCTGAFRWAERYGDASGQLPNGVAVDPKGNVIVVGRITGMVDFGGGSSTANGNDAFVLALDRQGRYLWSKIISGAGDQIAIAVAVAADGKIFVTGTTVADVDLSDLGGGTLMSHGSTDVFVVALDGGGKYLWGKLFGGTGADQPAAIAAGGDGSLALAGVHGGGIDFGGMAIPTAGGADVFVAKLAQSDGGYVWAKGYGDTGDESVGGVALTSAGDVIVAGSFPATINFGGGKLTSAGGTDLFVARLVKDSGGQVWAKRFGDPVVQAGGSVAVDGSGNVVVVGYGSGQFDLGGTNKIGDGSTKLVDFVAELDPNGAHLWSLDLGGSYTNVTPLPPVVALDGDGNVVVGATFAGTIGFGGPLLTSAGSNDYAVGKLLSTGDLVWNARFGDVGIQTLSAVAAGPTGEVVLAGGNFGVIDFGGGPLATAGANDIMIAELAP